MSGQRPRRLREGIQQANRSGAAIAGGCESGHRLAISAVRHCPRAGSRVGPTPLEGSSACCGTGCEMKKVALSEVKDDLSRYLRLAEKEEIVVTRHGKGAGERRERLRRGLPFATVNAVGAACRIAVTRLAAILSIPERTCARRRHERRLRAGESDRVVRVARIAALAEGTLGGKERAIHWL